MAQCATIILDMGVHIRHLIWGTVNIKHLAKHAVTPDEVEEVVHGNHFAQRERGKNRLGLIGPTLEGRFLKIILQPKKGRGVFFPVTAHNAADKEIALYKRKKGVNSNE